MYIWVYTKHAHERIAYCAQRGTRKDFQKIASRRLRHLLRLQNSCLGFAAVAIG
jgi:hypothetical protein